MGFEALAGKRKIIMGALVLLQMLAGILYIVGMVGWSKDDKNVMATYWAASISASDNDAVTLFALRNGVVADLSNDDTSADFDYDDCAGNPDWCDNCKEAGEAALATSLLGFFFCGGTLIVSAIRAMEKMDSKNIKIASAVIIVFQLLWSVIAVGTFKNQCIDMLPVAGGTIQELHTGPGYNCIATTCFIAGVTLLLHLLMPSVAGGNEDKLEEPLDTGASSSSSGKQENQV
jgi:hypothetical protein